LVLRLHGLSWGLPNVLEEGTTLTRAWIMMGPGPGLQLDMNPHTFGYPTLCFYLQLAVQLLLYVWLSLTGAVTNFVDFRALHVIDHTPFFIAGRALNAGLGVATVAVTFALGRRVAGNAAGALAAILLAFHPLHIDKSQTVEVDIPLVLFTTLANLVALRLLDRRSIKTLILGGVLGGLAASAKYPGALTLVPLFMAVWLSSAPGGSRIRDALIVFGAFVAAFFFTSPYVVLDFPSFLRDVGLQRAHMELGHFGLRGPAWRFYGSAMVGSLIGVPLLVAGLGGLADGLRRKDRAVLVLGSFGLVYLASFFSYSTFADRYLLPILPVVMVLGAAAVGRLLVARPAAPPFAWPLAGLLFALPGLLALPAHFRRSQSDTRSLVTSWIETHVPSGAWVVTEFHGPDLHSVWEMQRLVPEVRARILARAPNLPVYATYVLPLYEIEPERSMKFYDLRLYPEADLVVTSSSVRDRYSQDPRFAAQQAFYDTLERNFVRLKEFAPGKGPGPRIVVYQRADADTLFSECSRVRAPDFSPLLQGAPLAEESLCCLQLGMNYEYYGFPQPSIECYLQGMRFPPSPLDTHALLAIGASRCMMKTGQRALAASFLQWAIGEAVTPREAAWLRRLLQDARAASSP